MTKPISLSTFCALMGVSTSIEAIAAIERLQKDALDRSHIYVVQYRCDCDHVFEERHATLDKFEDGFVRVYPISIGQVQYPKCKCYIDYEEQIYDD